MRSEMSFFPKESLQVAGLASAGSRWVGDYDPGLRIQANPEDSEKFPLAVRLGLLLGLTAGSWAVLGLLGWTTAYYLS